MDESQFHKLVDPVFRTIVTAFDALDPDVVEAVTTTEGVITLVFGSGMRCVLNTQRPTRQLWLAFDATAWHFSWDAESKRWLDDKGRGELFATIRSVVKKHANVDVALPS